MIKVVLGLKVISSNKQDTYITIDRKLNKNAVNT